ncbi:hypothetical protein, partial [Klebsiella pneumoniae]|uniref:hypothetical protein n=1 Tax=Klebsiella pneumoniae TaxID=573 RepID=UPI001C6FB0A4
AGISLPEGIPAAADIVNLRYKSCSEMEGQDQSLQLDLGKRQCVKCICNPFFFINSTESFIHYDPLAQATYQSYHYL